jgi:hypothetical protein
MSYTYRLGAEEWLLIGYCIGVIVLWVAQRLGSAGGRDASRSTGQEVRLDERSLERLEEGEQVRIRRWHGGNLVLDGSVIVSVPSETDDESEE